MDFSKIDINKILHNHKHTPILKKDILRVSEYERDFPIFAPLTHQTRDLKDEQRSWTIRAVLNAVPSRCGRVLEIGAGEPLVAEILSRLGFEVYVVDPYDGSGGGQSILLNYRLRIPR